jgi:hypothetical protein
LAAVVVVHFYQMPHQAEPQQAALVVMVINLMAELAALQPQQIQVALAVAVADLLLLVLMLQEIMAVLVAMVVVAAERQTTLEHQALAVTA